MELIVLRIAMLLGSTDANDPKHDCGTQHWFATNKVRIVNYPQSTGLVIIVYCCPMFPLRTCMLMIKVTKGSEVVVRTIYECSAALLQ